MVFWFGLGGCTWLSEISSCAAGMADLPYEPYEQSRLSVHLMLAHSDTKQ